MSRRLRVLQERQGVDLQREGQQAEKDPDGSDGFFMFRPSENPFCPGEDSQPWLFL